MGRSSPYWLIASRATGPIEGLLVDGGRGKALPVFCSREKAEAYAETAGPGWCARECSAGELVSLLCGPCSGARVVLVDPPARISPAGRPPRAFGRRELMGLLVRGGGVSRPAFPRGFVGELS